MRRLKGLQKSQIVKKMQRMQSLQQMQKSKGAMIAKNA